MVKVLLVDDENNAIINMQSILQNYFSSEVEVVGVAHSVDEALSQFFKTKPDVVFLDIEMPPKTGFDLLTELKDYDFEVIFTTAYSNYGIDAIKFSALDYLLKPIDIAELKTAIQKATKKIEDKKVNASLQNLIDYLKNREDKSKHKIAISSVKETRFIIVDDIIRCESSNSYTIFHLKNEETLISSTSIFEYEKLLQNYDFIRCHQSHLVNSKYVKSILNENGSFLVLDNGAQVPISRQKKDFVKESLKSKLMN